MREGMTSTGMNECGTLLNLKRVTLSSDDLRQGR